MLLNVVMWAICNTLNIVVQKEFKCGTNAVIRDQVPGATRTMHRPTWALHPLRLRHTKKQVNKAIFGVPWKPADPIETYSKCLEDCLVTAINHHAAHRMAYIMDLAIMTLEITGLFTQALVEYKSKPLIDPTWMHSNATLQPHTTPPHFWQDVGYHSTSKVVENDNTLNNMEQMLNTSSRTYSCNNALHLSPQQLFSAFTQQLAVITQQLAQMAPSNTTATNSGEIATPVTQTANPSYQPWELPVYEQLWVDTFFYCSFYVWLRGKKSPAVLKLFHPPQRLRDHGGNRLIVATTLP